MSKTNPKGKSALSQNTKLALSLTLIKISIDSNWRFQNPALAELVLFTHGRQ